MILIINYGGQYVHRIWRSLREIGVESKIVPFDSQFSDLMSEEPKGFILSGGPHSVYDEKEFGCYKEILDSGLPVLGICFGHQLLCQHFGGEVVQGESGEYAAVEIKIKEENDLFKGLPDKITVWESHKDEVKSIPDELTCLAESEICPIEAVKHKNKPVYGVQFHPEVEHTPLGKEILKNFTGI